MTTQQSYIPGMCNINKAEVAYRKKAMWFGIILSVVLFGAMILLMLPVVFRILLFVPVYIAAIGYLQVKNKFCVAYGAGGRQNADDGSDVASEIADESARQADKKKSRKMNLQALGITLAVLIIALLIPNVQF